MSKRNMTTQSNPRDSAGYALLVSRSAPSIGVKDHADRVARLQSSAGFVKSGMEFILIMLDH
jgi:hypothetical protein